MPKGRVAERRQPIVDADRRLQALTDIGRLVTLGLDPGAIIEHTAEATARLLAAPSARVWQVDESSGDLLLVAAAGSMAAGAELGCRVPAARAVASHRALERGKVFQCPNPAKDRRWREDEIDHGLELGAYVGFPLRVGDRRYGLLAVRFHDARTVPQDDLDLVQALVGHAAVALHNAAVYAESRQHEDRLTVLAEITQLINSNLEPNAVFDATAQAARRLLDGRMANVWLYDDVTGLLTLRAHDPVGEPIGKRTLRLDDSIAGWVLQLGQPYISADITQHPLWNNAVRPGAGIRGGIFIPFRDHGKPIGVLVVLRELEQPLDKHEQQLLEIMGDQVVVAIQNARHFSAAREQTGKLAALMQVNRHLALGLKLEEILEFVAEKAAGLLDVEAANVRLLEEGQLLHMAGYGAGPALVVRERHSAADGLTGAVLSSSAPVMTTDLANEARAAQSYRERAASLGFRSWLGVPLPGRSELLGVLCIMTRRERQFTDAEIGLLESFGNQVAVAIENARLFAQEQDRRRQIDAIRDLASDVAQELDLDRVLELATLGATELLGAAFGALYLWDEPTQRLQRSAACGLARDLQLDSLRLNQGVSGTAAARRECVIENDYLSSSLALPEVKAAGAAAASLAEPILYNDRLVGVITLGHDDPTRRFTLDDSRFLSIFAGQVAIAIENARLFKQAARAEALDELARLKTEFLSTVSHELRTPLSLIHGYSELLITRGARLSGDQIVEMAREIHNGSKTMAALVDDLLDFSRIEQGRMMLKKRPCAISETLETIAREFKQLPGGERLDTRIAPDIHGEVDPERLAQVLQGLLNNAVQFAPAGRITLQAEQVDGLLEVSVADEGPGVPESEQARVWEKFFRGAAAVNSPLRGSGLGLALVEHIVTLHGGAVGVHSAPSAGARFWVRIPLGPHGGMSSTDG